MTPNRDLEPLGDTLSEVFSGLGFADPRLMAKLVSDWDSIAPNPWPKRSQPVGLRGRTLVVEASSPSMVAFLRYGASELIESLNGHLGEGVVAAVDIRPPGRSG